MPLVAYWISCAGINVFGFHSASALLRACYSIYLFFFYYRLNNKIGKRYNMFGISALDAESFDFCVVLSLLFSSDNQSVLCVFGYGYWRYIRTNHCLSGISALIHLVLYVYYIIMLSRQHIITVRWMT